MGFKLHIVINNKGAIMAIKITKANNSDLSVADDIYFFNLKSWKMNI